MLANSCRGKNVNSGGIFYWSRKPTFPCGRKTAKYGPQQINRKKQDPFLGRRELLKNKRLKKHKQEEESFYKDIKLQSKYSKHLHLWRETFHPMLICDWFGKFGKTFLFPLLHYFVLSCFFVFSCSLSNYLIGMLSKKRTFYHSKDTPSIKVRTCLFLLVAAIAYPWMFSDQHDLCFCKKVLKIMDPFISTVSCLACCFQVIVGQHYLCFTSCYLLKLVCQV